MSKLFVTKGQLLGTFAKYAVSQSPYHRPDNLELVLDKLSVLLDTAFANAPLGVAEFKDWHQLEELLALNLAVIPEYVAWNDRKNDNDAPMKFTSRYDGAGNPDDDFIDLDALQRNVAVEVDRESAVTQGSGLVATNSSQDKPLKSAQSNKGATNDIKDLHKWLEQSFAGFMVSDPMAHTRATTQMAADYAMKRIEAIIRSEIAQETNKARLDELDCVARANAFTTSDHDHNLIATHIKERKAQLESLE